MQRKPDFVRAIVALFVLGLVITGLTSTLQASEDQATPSSAQATAIFSLTAED
tara:strand:+ start:564 stop:722 length:159 start_codon:yes stop_codon:yes gene_type:complete